MLARTFGCARVVFNDALRLRDAAHEAGEEISGTEVQRRVVTLAKATPEREWLSGVASVALVQAGQDARRAYRNRFDHCPAIGRLGVHRESGGRQGPVVPAAAVPAVQRHGYPRDRRPVLRLVRGRARPAALHRKVRETGSTARTR